MRRLRCWIALSVALGASSTVNAGHPLLTYWARQSTGPYAPQTGRYVVVDPVPVAPTHSPHHHGAQAAAGTELWERRDLTPHTYPYGWFGAAPHASNSWKHTSYYDNYRDYRVLRGR